MTNGTVEDTPHPTTANWFLDTRLLILVLAIMDLSDQELCVALEEFERNMVDVSDLFLSLLENRLDQAIICAAAELERCRISTSSAKKLFEISSMLPLASKHVLGFNLFHVSSLTHYVNSSMVA